MAEPEFLSRKQASTYLESLGYPVTPRALERMALNGNSGNGPPYIRFRWRHVRYKRADLLSWAISVSEKVT